jgi:hypothetical protein
MLPTMDRSRDADRHRRRSPAEYEHQRDQVQVTRRAGEQPRRAVQTPSAGTPLAHFPGASDVANVRNGRATTESVGV